MQINEAYIRYLDLVNKNATNNNASVSKARFVINFNDIAIKYVEWMLEKKNDDSIRNIAFLLNLDKEINKLTSEDRFDVFNLPDDYFDFSNLSVIGSKNSCKEKRLSTYEAKADDVEELYWDESNKPSFEYRETFYVLSKDKTVSVYKDGFSIDKGLLSYIRKPKEVDIAGYVNANNQPSTNINPEFDDRVTLKILQAMAKDFTAKTGDSGNYQLNKDRLFSNI